MLEIAKVTKFVPATRYVHHILCTEYTSGKLHRLEKEQRYIQAMYTRPEKQNRRAYVGVAGGSRCAEGVRYSRPAPFSLAASHAEEVACVFFRTLRACRNRKVHGICGIFGTE